MFNKLPDLNYGEARYISLKEVDTAGPIGELLLMCVPQLATIMMQIGEFNDSWGDNLDNLPTDKIPEVPGISNHNELMQLNNTLPNLILLNSELDWNEFYAAYRILLLTHIAIAHDVYNHYAELNQENTMFGQEHQMLEELQNSFDPACRLLELGAGYMDLLNASKFLVDEMRTWRESNPAAVRLSQAYLKAIGFMPEDD